MTAVKEKTKLTNNKEILKKIFESENSFKNFNINPVKNSYNPDKNKSENPIPPVPGSPAPKKR